MAELRCYQLASILVLRHVEQFSDDEISEMLCRAACLGLPMGPGSPLEDVTLWELAILVAQTRGTN